MAPHRYTALLLGLFVLSTASVARAHDPGMSSLAIALDPNGLRATLRIHGRDAANFDDPRAFAARALVLTIGGQPVLPEAIDLERGADHFVASARYARPPGPLRVGAAGVGELPRGHRQLVRILAGDTLLASGLLAAGDPPLEVAASIARTPALASFVALGLEHVLTGWDHLLFLAALLLSSTAVRDAVRTVTAFTVAHSLTLAASTLGWLSLPAAWVEPAIAATIVVVGLRAAFARCSWRETAGLALGFGLIHGLGFAAMLRNLLGGTPDVMAPLVAFNVGVELGQLAVVLVALLPLRLGLQHPRVARLAVPATGLAIAGMGLFWMLERAAWPT